MAANCQSPKDNQAQYVLQKPQTLDQPVLNNPKSTQMRKVVGKNDMFKLLTDTTIHLKEEAERLLVATSSMKSQQMMTVARRSRDSETFLRNKGIYSHRGCKHTATIDLDAV